MPQQEPAAPLSVSSQGQPVPTCVLSGDGGQGVAAGVAHDAPAGPNRQHRTVRAVQPGAVVEQPLAP